MISFARTTNPASKPPFVVDQHSIMRDTGRQIDWDALGDRYGYQVHEVELTEAIALDETAITVTALTKDLPAETNLSFGTRAGFTVTLSAQANAAATSLAVTALPGALYAGERLDFTGAGEFALVSADAAAGATSVTVEALDAQIESADTATVPTQELVVRTSAAALEGAEAITIYASDFPIASGSIAYYGATGNFGAGRFIPAGTVMDLLSSGKIVPSALDTGGVTAYGILETNAEEDSRTDSASGYGLIKSGSFYENLLPEADGADPSVINSTHKTELLARGGFWLFEQYEDDTA